MEEESSDKKSFIEATGEVMFYAESLPMNINWF